MPAPQWPGGRILNVSSPRKRRSAVTQRGLYILNEDRACSCGPNVLRINSILIDFDLDSGRGRSYS